jgi:class 3 adenylate cyclase
VDAALAMLRGLEVLSKSMQREFGVALSIGVGIHFGPVIVGMVGPAHDLKLGLVGDCVNVASRLHSATPLTGDDLLVSSSVVELWDPDCYQLGPLHQLDLKGVKVMIEAQAVNGMAGASQRSR